MFGIPSPTPFDLNFRLLGIPVRIQAWFWVVTAFLGGVGMRGVSVQDVVIWILCVLVSILVHEYGHGLMARLLGFPAAIVLYGMGGLCFTDGERHEPWQRLLVLFAGPGAGFLLAGGVGLVWLGLTAERVEISPVGLSIIDNLLWINIVWGILNLMPIWPLDGGQVTAVVLKLINRAHGQRWAHVISLLTAAGIALFAYSRLGQIYLAVFFGLMALTNFQVLQILHAQARQGFSNDDGAWRN